MLRTLTPILSILIALGLLFSYVKPTFEQVKLLQDETQEYVQAIDRADTLRTRVNELIAKRNSFSPADLERLEAFLPDRINEVALMLDLNTLAKRHGLTFGNIKIADNDARNEIEPLPETITRSVLIDPNNPAAGSVEETISIPKYFTPIDISFSVVGVYEDFKSFIIDLEKSLALIDIRSLSISPTEGDQTTYTITTRLYSFNPGT